MGFKYASVLNISELPICQGSEFPGLYRIYLFTQIWQGSEYALRCNYGRVLNVSGFLICQVFACASITKGSAYVWIWLNNAWIDCSSNGRVLNMPCESFTGFWIYLWFSICQGWKYGKVVNIWRLHKVLFNICEYALMLNMLENSCIYVNKQSSEYARILHILTNRIHFTYCQTWLFFNK